MNGQEKLYKDRKDMFNSMFVTQHGNSNFLVLYDTYNEELNWLQTLTPDLIFSKSYMRYNIKYRYILGLF